MSVDACGEDVKDHVTDHVGVMLGGYDGRSGDGRRELQGLC